MNTDRLRHLLNDLTYDTSELLEIAAQLDAHQAEHEDIALQLSILSGHIIPDRCMDDAPEEREDTPLHELAGIDEPVEQSYVEDSKWEMDEAGNEPKAEQNKLWKCSQCGHAERIQNEDWWFCNQCGLRVDGPVRPDEEPEYIEDSKWEEDMTDPAPNEAPTTSGHGHLVGWNVNITPAAIISGGESGDEICAEIRELLAPLAEAAPSLKDNCDRIYELVTELEAERDAALRPVSDHPRCGVHGQPQPCAICGLREAEAEIARLKAGEKSKSEMSELNTAVMWRAMWDTGHAAREKAMAERDALALSLQQQEEETTKALAERDAAQAQVAALVAAAVDRSYANNDAGLTFSKCRICCRGWSGTADGHADDCPIRALTNPKEGEDTDIEALAIYAHTAWSGWMAYMFSKCSAGEDGTIVIPADLADRWQRQAATAYADLPESEKESDRDEARRMLAIIRANLKGGGDAVL